MLPEREHNDHSIHESTTVSIWEEDFSWCKEPIDNLRKKGVTEFRQYFENHPEFVAEALHHIKVLDVNQASLALFFATTKQELTAAFDRVIVPETMAVFMGALVAIAEGRKYFESEAVLQTLKGKRLNIHAAISFPDPDSKFDHFIGNTYRHYGKTANGENIEL